MSDPAAPEDLAVVTGEAVELSVRPTSFALRAAGGALDFAAEAVVFLGLLFAATEASSGLGDQGSALSALTIASLVLAFVIAPTVVETATHGRSLGRVVVGARIVRDDGGAIGLRHAFVRALMGLVEIVGTLGGVAVVAALLNRRTKRLGDLLAGTVSQQERVARPTSNAFGVPVELAAWATTADVARLPDPLARRIAAFLRQAAAMQPDSRARLAAALATEAAPFVAPLPTADPELLVAAVGAIRREREYRALELESERLSRLDDLLTTNPHAFPQR